MLWKGSAIAIAALGIGAPAVAQQDGGNAEGQVLRPDPGAKARAREADTLLLAALLRRRTHLGQADAGQARDDSAGGSGESRRLALDFLDGRLAEMKRRLRK